MGASVGGSHSSAMAVAVSLILLMGQAGCGLNSAPGAKARADSTNQMKHLLLGMALYRDVHEGQWPEDLTQVQPFLTDVDFDQLMHNPVTGDRPGYEYVKPSADADPDTTVVLYQLRNGQRDENLRVGLANNRVSNLGSPAGSPTD